MAAHSTLSALPPALVQRILALLPVDARARAATVCRTWRDSLADARLWTRLDLSDESGVTCRVDDAAVRAAAARARGALQMLDARRAANPIGTAAVLQVVQANAATLRELRMGSYNVDDLTPLLLAAPELRVLSADVSCPMEQAPALLQNEPPYGPLRLRELRVTPHEHDNHGQHDAVVRALAAALPAHAALCSLVIFFTQTNSDAACGALVDGVLAARLPSLMFHSCATSSATVSALARLLDGGTLKELRLERCPTLLHGVPSVKALAAALRASTSLTTLDLTGLCLWMGALPGLVLLGALNGHLSLRRLLLRNDTAYFGSPPVAAAGDALGALVAANARALTELDVSGCWLGDEVLGSLCDALPHNTHLRILDVSCNAFSADFAAERLAVRANASLRQLHAVTYTEAPALAEAVDLVSARATETRATEECVNASRRGVLYPSGAWDYFPMM